jgi:hypothetical protein
MSETTGAGESGWERGAAQLVIVTIVFPILVLAFHTLLVIPALILGRLLSHLGGTAEFWAKVLSVMALLIAGFGAVFICGSIWPRRKHEESPPDSK